MGYPGKPTPKGRRRVVEQEPVLTDGDPTLQRCELCGGCGMVPPEVGALFAETLRKIKEQA